MKELYGKVSEATKNVRALQITIGLWCALGFLTLFNSSSTGWFQQRLEIHEDQIKWVEHLHSTSQTPPKNLTSDELKRYEKAMEMYNERSYTPSILQQQYLSLRRARNDNMVLVSLPMFDTKFEANDLAFLAGLTYNFLLFLTLYSLIAKRHRLESLFTLVKEMNSEGENKKYALSLLRMNQILTIPLKKEDYSLTRKIPKQFFFLPIATYIIIGVNDLLTRDYGNLLSEINTRDSLLFSLVFGISLLVLSEKCLKETDRLDEFWQRVTEEIA